jgi:hypothetical protein
MSHISPDSTLPIGDRTVVKYHEFSEEQILDKTLNGRSIPRCSEHGNMLLHKDWMVSQRIPPKTRNIQDHWLLVKRVDCTII